MPAKKIIKNDIIDSIYEKTELNRNDIRKTVDIFIEELKTALVNRSVVELRGFGTFEVKVRKARLKARNPKTGENIAYPSHGAVSFRSGRELKQLVRDITEE